jgi:hypothetical protein
MIRGAIGRIRRSAPLAVAIILTTSVAVGYSSTPAGALGIQPATASVSRLICLAKNMRLLLMTWKTLQSKSRTRKSASR